VIIMLIFLLFAIIVGYLVANGQIDITSMFNRVVKQKALENTQEIYEIVQPPAHSYWDFYWNGEYYWTYIVIKSNVQLESAPVQTSFPLTQPPEIVQQGQDEDGWYYYRVVLKTKKLNEVAESFSVMGSRPETVTIYPNVVDVTNKSEVEITSVLIKDQVVLPAILLPAMMMPLFNELSKAMAVYVQNTGDDFVYQTLDVTVDGQAYPVMGVYIDGKEVKPGDVIKSGDIVGVVLDIDGHKPADFNNKIVTVDFNNGQLKDEKKVNVAVAGGSVQNLANVNIYKFKITNPDYYNPPTAQNVYDSPTFYVFANKVIKDISLGTEYVHLGGGGVTLELNNVYSGSMIIDFYALKNGNILDKQKTIAIVTTDTSEWKKYWSTVIKNNIMYTYKQSCDSNNNCKMEVITVDIQNKQVLKATRYYNIPFTIQKTKLIHDDNNVYILYLDSSGYIHLLKQEIGNNYFTQELVINPSSTVFNFLTDLSYTVKMFTTNTNSILVSFDVYNKNLGYVNLLVLEIDKNTFTVKKAYLLDTGRVSSHVSLHNNYVLVTTTKWAGLIDSQTGLKQYNAILLDMDNINNTIEKTISITVPRTIYYQTPGILTTDRYLAILDGNTLYFPTKFIFVFDLNNNFNFVSLYNYTSKIIKYGSIAEANSQLYVSDTDIFRWNYNVTGVNELSQTQNTLFNITLTDLNVDIIDYTTQVQSASTVYTYTPSDSASRYPMIDVTQYYHVYTINPDDIILVNTTTLSYNKVIGS